MNGQEHGVTLTEVVVASAIAFVVIIGIGSIEVSRMRMGEDTRGRQGITAPTLLQSTLTTIQISKELEGADRAILDGGNAIYQFRIPEPDTDNPPTCPAGSCTTIGTPPAPCCFDISANYRWVQYVWDPLTRDVTFYRDMAACTPSVVARGVQGLTMFFVNGVTNPPPGGDPPLLSTFNADPTSPDNNIVAYWLFWYDSLQRYQFYQGDVVIRASSMSNVNTNCPVDTTGLPCDSGSGLAPNQPAFDPPVCP